MLKKFSRKRGVFYRKKYILISCISLCVLVVMSIYGYFSVLNTIIQPISLPVVRQFYITKNRFLGVMNSFIHTSKLQRENNKLRADIAEMRSKLLSYKDVLEENNILRDQLNIKNLQSKKVLLAKVSLEDDNVFTDNIILNVGNKDGVEIDDLVIFHNILIGKIVKVEKSISYLRLITDLNSVFPVDIISDNRYRGILKGELGEESLIVSNIEKNANITEGNDIILSQDNTSYGISGDLFIGKIKRVVDVDNEAYKNAIIEPAIKYNDLDKVFVIL